MKNKKQISFKKQFFAKNLMYLLLFIQSKFFLLSLNIFYLVISEAQRVLATIVENKKINSSGTEIQVKKKIKKLKLM